MKTTMINLPQPIKVILFTITFLFVSMAFYPQDSCITIINKKFEVKICGEQLAYTTIPKIKEIYINPKANVYYIEFEEEEGELKIENWMSAENFSNKEISENEPSNSDLYETDSTLNPFIFEEEEEPELDIEPWMSDIW